MSLPQPEALQHSEKLANLIRDEIKQSGPVSFARFMQYALYEPGLGYYMSGTDKFGEAGDFITAPEISPLFARCIGVQCRNVMRQLLQPRILEFGAGSGIMAADLLTYLQGQDSLPVSYAIVELSAPLRQLQRRTLQQRVPDLVARVQWLSSLEALKFEGIILANEVLDAMPVERFEWDGSSVYQIYVDCDARQDFCYLRQPAKQQLASAVEPLVRNWSHHYHSEINLYLLPWIKTLSHCLQKGVALVVDYGYPRDDYYTAERSEGTLMCHYRHRAHDNPLLWVGLQDITAHVEFTALAEAADQCGLTVAGFTDLCRFLLDCGFENLLADMMQDSDTGDRLKFVQHAKTLISPGQMGDRFKVMALTKQYNHALTGFDAKHDLRHYL